jgi:hypothetical protein
MDCFRITGEVDIWRVRVGPGCNFARLDQPLDRDILDSLSREGEALLAGTYRNKVVDLGRSIIRALIGNGAGLPSVTNGVQSYGTTTIADLAITQMRFGNLTGPTAPASGDYQLQDLTLLHTATPTVAYPGNFSVRWRGLIPANTYTGQQVTEEGLFASSGALFARTTFAPQAIVLGFAVQFDHSFSISAA